MSNDRRKTFLSGTSVKDTLRAKSRRRREQLTELAAASSAAGHPIRNDLVPKLALIECPPADLVVPARNVRKIKAAHLREVATAISSLGFCDPVLVDERNAVLDGVVRVEAAKLLGLPHIPCIRVDHLSTSERRLVRMALNRLSEKGSWNFDELKLEMKELILENTPIEISGFSMPEIEQIIIGDEPAAIETGPLAPEPDAKPIVQVGDIFVMGDHRIICGDATDAGVLEILMSDTDKARLILTDEPYNVPVAGHETSGVHREFLMDSGAMTDAEFRAFNTAWMGAALGHLCDGGLFATFIDWRGYPTVVAAALEFGLAPFDLIVWAKTNADAGNFYRSQHELLPLFKKGDAPHINNIERRKNGRRRSNVWTYPGAYQSGVRSTRETAAPPHCQAGCHAGRRAARHDRTRRHCPRPIPRFGIDTHRLRKDRPTLPRPRARSSSTSRSSCAATKR